MLSPAPAKWLSIQYRQEATRSLSGFRQLLVTISTFDPQSRSSPDTDLAAGWALIFASIAPVFLLALFHLLLQIRL